MIASLVDRENQNRIILMGLFSLTLFVFNDVFAQAPPPLTSSNVALPKKEAGGSKKRAEVSFEDELVQGEVKKPELFYLLQKKQFNYKRLLRLRENFLPEMKRTATEIQRGGSVD